MLIGMWGSSANPIHIVCAKFHSGTASLDNLGFIFIHQLLHSFIKWCSCSEAFWRSFIVPKSLYIAESLSISISGMSYLQLENICTNESN